MEVTLTLFQIGLIVSYAVALAVLPGGDLARLALAVLYKRYGVKPEYVHSVNHHDQ